MLSAFDVYVNVFELLRFGGIPYFVDGTVDHGCAFGRFDDLLRAVRLNG